eukprot:Awhi_evm1s2298
MKAILSVIAQISLIGVLSSNALSIIRRDTDSPCNTGATCPAGSLVINGISSCCPTGYHLETNDFGLCVCSITLASTDTGSVGIERRDVDLPCTTGSSCPTGSPLINGVPSCCSTGYYQDISTVVVDDAPCMTGATCPVGSPVINGAASCCSAGYYLDINDLGQCVCSSNSLTTSPTTNSTYSTTTNTTTILNTNSTKTTVVDDGPCSTGAACPIGSPVINGEASCCSTGYYQDINDIGQCVCSSVSPSTSTTSTSAVAVDDTSYACSTGAACPTGSPVVYGVVSCCSSGLYMEINDLGQCMCSNASTDKEVEE